MHIRLHREPGWRSACAISTTINCDAVVTSAYGAIGGTPLSAIATWFYSIMAFIAASQLRVHPPKVPRSPAAFILLGAAVATCLSAVLAGVSAFSLHAWCVLCVALYAVNGAMLLVAWVAARKSGEGMRLSLAAERRHWAMNLVPAMRFSGPVFLALAALLVGFRSRAVAPSAVCTLLLEAAAKHERAEPVTIDIYLDFQCPKCRELDRQIRPLRHDPRWRILHRHFPLDMECNSTMRRVGHAGACLQARAAICAGVSRCYDEYSDALFEEAPRDEADLIQVASSLGIDRGEFESCLRSRQSLDQLDEDVQAGIDVDIRATPTTFVNGRRHVGPLDPADLACIADLAGAKPGNR